MTIHKPAFAAVALAGALSVAAMLFVDPVNAVSTSGPVFRNDTTAKTMTQPAEAAPMADSTPSAAPVATDNTKKAPVEAAPAATKPAAAVPATKPADATPPVQDKKVIKAPADAATSADASTATAPAIAGPHSKPKKLKKLYKAKKYKHKFKAKKAHYYKHKYKRSAFANGARSRTSKACSIKANVLHLHGKARKVFRHKCLKKAA